MLLSMCWVENVSTVYGSFLLLMIKHIPPLRGLAQQSLHTILCLKVERMELNALRQWDSFIFKDWGEIYKKYIGKFGEYFWHKLGNHFLLLLKVVKEDGSKGQC